MATNWSAVSGVASAMTWISTIARAGQHEVGVRLGGAVLGEIKIEHRLAAHEPAGDGGHGLAQGQARQLARRDQPGERLVQSDVGAGDRRRARAAIGAQHVAVEHDLALAHGVELGDRAQRAPDQPLDLHGQPDCRPRTASRSVRLSVERGSMPYSAVTQPRPVLRRNGGTRSCTVAAQSTWVLPKRTRHEPSARSARSRARGSPGGVRARRVRTVACGVSQLVGTVLAQAGSARQTALLPGGAVGHQLQVFVSVAAIRCGFEPRRRGDVTPENRADSEPVHRRAAEHRLDTGHYVDQLGWSGRHDPDPGDCTRPPKTRRFRLLAPVLVLLGLALLALVPGILIRIGDRPQDAPAQRIDGFMTYEGR